MKQYQCLDCGYQFDTPKEYTEDCTPGDAFEGGSFIKHYLGCPICSGAYEELQECHECGEMFLDKDLYYHVCEKCREELESKEVE